MAAAGDFHTADSAAAAAVVVVVAVGSAPAPGPAEFSETQVWSQGRGLSDSSTNWVVGDSGALASVVHAETSACQPQHVQGHHQGQEDEDCCSNFAATPSTFHRRCRCPGRARSCLHRSCWWWCDWGCSRDRDCCPPIADWAKTQ